MITGSHGVNDGLLAIAGTTTKCVPCNNEWRAADAWNVSERNMKQYGCTKTKLNCSRNLWMASRQSCLIKSSVISHHMFGDFLWRSELGDCMRPTCLLSTGTCLVVYILSALH